jgi:integrase
VGGRYTVRTIVLESGERLPLLLNCDTGSPLFEPTVYSLTELRARNRASATIEQALRAVAVLLTFLDSRGIDLEARLAQGRMLELGEIDDLARQCRLPMEAFERERGSGDQGRPLRNRRASRLESIRMRSPLAVPEIDPSSAALRVRYIRAYLRWLAIYRLQRLEPGDPTHAALLSTSEIVVRVLGERTPSVLAKDVLGLSDESLARLNEVIAPSGPNNPWKGAHARERNALMVHWLQSLGLRRGELLGIRIPNIDFQANEVRVMRNADDPADPRTRQPNTKTRGRLLPLDEDLVQRTRYYILNTRRQFEGARKHDFLFVANGTGAPLAIAAVDKIFLALRQKCPDLPAELTAHVLRHTWNDRFSELMDKNRVSEDTERKMRSRLMGWSETSKSATTYTRRHVNSRSREASLQLQRSFRTGKQK